jgi:xanthine dehydrogenase accessory factor
MRVRDVLDRLLDWWSAGAPSALATVTATWSSAPRLPGSAMAVGPDGTVVGSVSGGCVEAAVYEMCQEAIVSGEPRTARFGVSDDEAFAVGLTCGGTIEVLVERVDQESFPELPALAKTVEAGQPVALVTRLGDAAHVLVTPGEDTAAAGLLATGRTGLIEDGPQRLLVNVFAAPARMIVFGSTEQAAATTRIGSFLGYRVTVCDARPVFATADRFPSADEVVVDWPHRYLAAQSAAGLLDSRTVLLVLTHDPKFDVPVLDLALRLPVAYVGAMGSRRTHQDRLRRLRETGLGEAELNRLASPLGLDLGARTPEETAISIAAEIVALRWGGTGARLAGTRGPIHSR